MKRIIVPERPDWKTTAENLGFAFHTMYGEPYWHEGAAYEFTLRQIEDDLEDPSTELHRMCLDMVDRAVNDEATLTALAIPPEHWDLVRDSWQRRDASLYGRFDLFYDGTGPAKLLEYNADTPTSLYESAFFQWLWLEENIKAGTLPEGADQFNSIQERLSERLAEIIPAGEMMHFASVGDSIEDRQTVRYLEDIAAQGGLDPRYVPMETIGVDDEGRFADAEGWVITTLFKLYPWEMILREPFAEHLAGSGTQFIEPPWKAILSNKGLLALLWDAYPGHPNLLPTYFQTDPRGPANLTGRVVRKPLFSREGANIEVFEGDGTKSSA
ncbi:MAG: glutathionylspermidine synthase family protein, partial [Rhodospirillaceae bacterium]